MHTPASIAKHPIHPMLITIPIGLWIFSFVCDLINTFGIPNANWEIVALYSMIGGVIGALIAALPGLVDLLSLPKGIQRVAITHMSLNLIIVALFAINAWLRVRQPTPNLIWLSAAAIVLLVISGWLGGKMVHEHGVGVEMPPETIP